MLYAILISAALAITACVIYVGKKTDSFTRIPFDTGVELDGEYYTDTDPADDNRYC